MLTDCGHIDSFSVSLLITAIVSIQAVFVVCCLLLPPKIDLTPKSEENNLNEALEMEVVSSGSFMDLIDAHKKIKWKRFQPKNWLIDKDDIEEITDKNGNIQKKKKKNKFGFCYVWRKYGKSLIFFGLFGFGLNWVRRTRKMILTFRGLELGLSQGNIGTVNSLSFIPDFGMFMIAGIMMDKYGRKSTAIPSLTLFVIGLGSVAFANSYWSLIIVAIIFGFADGFTAGLLMTSSTDLAPKECRSEFLAQVRVLVKLPIVLCPTIIGNLCTHVSLFSAAMVGVVIGTISLIWIVFVMEDPAKTAQKRELKEIQEKMAKNIEKERNNEVVVKDINDGIKESLNSQLLNSNQVTIN